MRSSMTWDEATCVHTRCRMVHTVMGQQAARIASACSVHRLHSRGTMADDTIDAPTCINFEWLAFVTTCSASKLPAVGHTPGK